MQAKTLISHTPLISVEWSDIEIGKISIFLIIKVTLLHGIKICLVKINFENFIACFL